MKTPSSSSNGPSKPTLRQSARLHPYLPPKEALINAYLNALDSDLFARGRLFDHHQRLEHTKARVADLRKTLTQKQAERRALARQVHVLEQRIAARENTAQRTIVRAWRRFAAAKKRSRATPTTGHEACREQQVHGGTNQAPQVAADAAEDTQDR